MNGAMDTIFTRRGTGKFLNRLIPDEDLQQVIQTVLHAPSGMGKQTWRFTVVKNREKIRELIPVARAILNREGYDTYRSGVLVTPLNDRESPFGRENNMCAMENILLAAHFMGIDSVQINQLQGICGDPATHQTLSPLDVSQGHVVHGMAALRYADDRKAEKERIGGIVIVE